MESEYRRILKEWTEQTALPAVYENLDRVFPEFAFRRFQKGTPRDHWASRYKLDLSLPKTRNAEKTVVYFSEMRFREQGDWNNPVSIIDMVIRLYNTASFIDSWKYLDSLLSLGMPRPDSDAVRHAVKTSNDKKRLLSFLQSLFSESLLDMSSRKAGETRAYLKGRGFGNEIWEIAGFGHVPEWGSVIRLCADEGFSLEELDSCCGVRGYDGKTQVGKTYTLSIPYISAGEIKGFIFRRTDGNGAPKYIATKGLERASSFFNIPEEGCRRLIVVEGEIDALSGKCAGIEGLVSMGGSSLSGNRGQMVEDAVKRGVEEFVLFPDLDADSNGTPDYRKRHESLMRSIHTIKDIRIDFEKIFVVMLNEVTDPDEYMRSRGVDEFKKAVEEALPYWKYIEWYNKNT